VRGAARAVWVRVLLLIAVWGLPLTGSAAPDAAQTLHQRYAQLRGVLASNVYQRPLFLDSSETKGSSKGDTYLVVQHPFAGVVAALSGSSDWCDVLILHINTKYCRPAVDPSGANLLQVAMGRKFDQALDDTYQVDFVYRLLHADAKFLQVTLDAAKGPMGTRDYRIVLEAVPLDDARTFIHLSYAYAYGASARFATQTYLATLGRSKVGFTIMEWNADGEPIYVEGMRGAVERNTMRYGLAIEAYLGAYSTPSAQRIEKRLRDWFAATEQFAPQLQEMELDEYLQMKHREILRQGQSGATK